MLGRCLHPVAFGALSRIVRIVGIGIDGRSFSHNLTRLLVFAQTLKGGMTQCSLRRPLCECDFSDKLWRYPAGPSALGAGRGIAEWGIFLPDGVQLPAYRVQCLLIET